MKRYDAESIYKLLNLQVPDSPGLAALNVNFEIHEGLLPHMILDGEAKVLAHRETRVVAVVAFVVTATVPLPIRWVYGKENEAFREEVTRRGVALAKGVEIENFKSSHPPYTVGALAACKGIDGDVAYAFYSHPQVEMGQSVELVSRIAAVWAAGEDPAASDLTKN